MNLIKRLRRWCPEPKGHFSTNFTRLSKPVVAGVLFAEIVALLIAPMAYYALFPPKVDYGLMQTFPLTNSQIAASWPNLPTANQIAQSGVYLTAGPGATSSVKNCTVLNMPDFYHGGLIPVGYDIWLQYNGTWLQVPNAYLATNNPPPVPPLRSGFLGTGLPTIYVVLAIVVIVMTLATGVSYLNFQRKKNLAKLGA